MSNLENYIGKCYDKVAKRYVCSINNNIESLKANDFNIDDVVIRYPKNNEFMSKRAFILANKI